MPLTISSSPLETASLREREFALADDVVYLNAASVAPLAERARRAAASYNLRRSHIHELGNADFEATLQRCRQAAARLIRAEPDEIALMGNTSFGINLAAQCLPLEPGSTVVVSDREFPANVYPWMALGDRGVRLEIVPADRDGWPDEDRLLERLDRGDVSVFALSAVQFASGFRADLERFGRFCRERGIFFVVDAIQALGCVPLDARTIDADILATGGHKWLCGPFGTGFVYVRGDLYPLLEPRVVGWTSMLASEDYDAVLDYRWEFRSGARKFEVGTVPFQDIAGLTESVELLLEVGIERIEAHVIQLLDILVVALQDLPGVEILSNLEPRRRSGILAFRPRSVEAVFARLKAAGVLCTIREGSIRISPHLYNTEEEMARVIEVLRKRGR
jgi:cysteine desulfurase/selenocysteine lyase